MKLTKLALSLVTLSLATFGQAPAPAASRLLCMYLDLGSLNAADLATAKTQAIKFVEEQMTSADRISIMTHTSQVNVLQDFTGDHNALRVALESIMALDSPATDDTDILKADRQLAGLQDALKILGAIPDKKAILYFSHGISKNGIDNEAQLRATTNAAMRANVSIYPIDARGLVSTQR